MLNQRIPAAVLVMVVALHCLRGHCSATPLPEISPPTANTNELAPKTPNQATSKTLFQDSSNTATSLQEMPSRAEKLKRGLASFLNKNNPASFFVPTPQQVGGLPVKSGSASSAEPASLVNGDPSAEAVIKGPQRLAHTRPIGGPLRWGRR